MNSRYMFALTLFACLAGADGLRDPTRPPMPQQAPGAVAREPVPTVTAVFTSGESRKAIVAGRLVKAGDSIGDGIVESVTDGGVIWRHRGAAHELLLPRPLANFKKAATGPARTDNGVQ